MTDALATPLWMGLNPYAVSFIIAANSLAIAIAVLFSAKGYPQPISRSLMIFGSGKALVGIGFMLFALRTELHPGWSIVAGNTLSVIGYCSNMIAIRAVQEKSLPIKLSVILSVLALGGSMWFAIIAPDLRGVRIIISLLALIITLVVAFELLWRFRCPGRAHYLGGAMALLLAVALAGRAVMAINGGSGQSVMMMASDQTERIFFVFLYIAATVAALNFTMISNDAFNEELRRQAASDPLTGLANRRRLLERGEEEARRARRYRRPLALLVLDIDHFKRINDSWGHATGDVALKAVAERCRDTLRDIDIIGRLGGEEFVAILPETGSAAGIGAAERLRAALAAVDVDSTPPLRLTVSVGVAVLRDKESFADALARADAAMYRAKQAGRNCVRCEGPTSPAADVA